MPVAPVQLAASPQPATGLASESRVPSAAGPLLIFVVASFVVLGLLVAPGSSVTAKPTLRHQTLFFRQLGFAAFGTIGALVAARISAQRWHQLAPWLYAAAVAGLVALLVPGVGQEINGARRWFRLGSLTVQWSECARLAVILFTARLAATESRWSWRHTLLCLAPGAVASALVVIQPDFGGGMLIMALSLAIVFLGGVPWSHLAVIVLLATGAGTTALVAAPYRMKRIEHFLQSWVSVEHAPYQVKQSLLSFVSGGWWGTGLGAGWQKLGFLPEASTDYVFAIIGEELGTVGALMVVAGWMAFLWSGWVVATESDGKFGRLAGYGLVVSVALQALTHLCVVLALVPPKGIGLPFVSYGGSNLTASLTSIGLLFGLARQQLPLRRRCCDGGLS